MTEQDDPSTVVIGQIEGGYLATVSAYNVRARGVTIAEAYRAALDVLKDVHSRPLPVRVGTATSVSAKQLVHLLRATGEPRLINLTMCRLQPIDLSPTALDALGVEDQLRWKNTRGIDLRGVNLEQARLDHANLECAELARANLKGAWVEGANLQGAWFWYANLQDAVVWKADLRNAHLESADLRGAQFRDAQLDGADLGGADLREVDFRDAASLTRVRWHNARLEKTWFYRHQIHPIQDELDAKSGDGRFWKSATGYREAMETYLSLKTNFLSLGTYEGAAWAYVKEQQMRKATYFPTTAGRRWLVRELAEEPPPHWWSYSLGALRYRLRSAWLHVWLFLGRVPSEVNQQMAGELGRWRWARNWLFELLTGYGERPQMPVLWALVTIFAFLFAYWGAGNIATGDPSVNPTPTHSFVAALTHSVAAFGTIGFNTLEPVGWGARLLTAVESMLGISFFALFIYTIGNRMSRS